MVVTNSIEAFTITVLPFVRNFWLGLLRLYLEIAKSLSATVSSTRFNNNRMRLIAMTTIAAMFALLPLALGVGVGAEMLQPLAIGLIIQLALVLLFLPCL